MPDGPRLDDLLLEWQECADRGESVAPEVLCRDCLELLPELRRRVAILEGFRPPPDVTLDQTGPAVETSDASAKAGPGGPARDILEWLNPAQTANEIGRLGRYRILRVLGAGGMGVVLEGEDPALKRRVALKVMQPRFASDVEARARFLREAEATARLEHEHIVTIHEVAEDPHRSVAYLAMQLLKGEPLDARLKREGHLSPAECARIGREVAEGLAVAHAAGLIHRDVKPANVWLDQRGKVKLLDFGLARPAEGESELSDSGQVVGTPAYMSPQQARAEHVDYRTDLFSLGVVLYRMATGEQPFRGPTVMAVLTSLAVDHPPPPREVNPAVPPALSDLIMRLLAKDPADRPASARVVADELGEADRPAPAAQPRRNRRWAWPVMVAAVLAVAGGAIIATRNKDGATVSGEGNAPVTIVDPDRRAAEYVLSVGGIVGVNEDGRWINSAAELPGGRFTLTGMDLRENKSVTDAGLANFEGCTGLTQLRRFRTGVTDVGLAYLKDCKGLTEVNLVSTGVTDAWLAHLGSCTSLTVLYLSKTNVTDEGLAHLQNCHGLTLLDLGDTKVTDEGLAHFKHCTNLTSLALFGTNTTDVGLAYFGDCKDLQWIHIGGPGLTDAGLAHFKDCKRLKRLLAYGRGVTDVGLAHFKDCTDLTHLNLAGTGVTDVGLAYFEDCKGLAQLDVRESKVTPKGVEAFARAVPVCEILHDGGAINAEWRAADWVLSEGGVVTVRVGDKEHQVDAGQSPPSAPFRVVRVIFWGNINVTDAGLAHLRGLTHLHTLGLLGTGVTDAGLAHLRDLPNLADLALNLTSVSDAGLAHLRGLPSLTVLNLDETRVTDAGLEHLTGLRRLKHLRLSGTNVTDRGLERLRELSALQMVLLDRTAVTDAGLEHLRALPRLTQLGLAGSRVTDAGLARLRGLPGLAHLSLHGSQLTDTGLEHLQAMSGLTGLGLPDVDNDGLARLRGLGNWRR